MKKCVFFVFICFVFVANTQEVLLYEYLNVNNIRALINPVGNQFNDFDNNNVFQVPADSSTMTIYSSSLWIGGKDANSQLKFAGEQSRGFGKDFFPGPLVANGSNIATITDSVSQSWNRLWRMTREEIDQFVLCFNNPSYPSYEIPNSIIEWPANGDAGLEQASHLAPYFDNNNDGYYNPFDGDHPMF